MTRHAAQAEVPATPGQATDAAALNFVTSLNLKTGGPVSARMGLGVRGTSQTIDLVMLSRHKPEATY
jgi:hypothetical protein